MATQFASQGKSTAAESGISIEASVVLPSYNRSETLMRVLTALEEQHLPASAFEVVVVDDGSSDSTAEVLAVYANRTKRAFSFGCLMKNCGPARARNEALKMCQGRIVVITGDDIVPNPDFVKQHLDWHSRHSADCEALLGYVTWPDEIDPSPFMKWLQRGGRAFFFNFADLPLDKPVDPSFFYTCNVSLKRSFLFKSALCDESFPYASHEDLELGCRLGNLGMKLFFDRSVLGYHWHHLTVKAMARRVYLMGYSADLFWEKVHDNSSLGRKTMRHVLTTMSTLPLAAFLWRSALKRCGSEHKNCPFCWKMILTLSYWIGFADARRNSPARLSLWESL